MTKKQAKREVVRAYLRLRAEGHSANCQCHNCTEVRRAVLRLGEGSLVYDENTETK